MAKSRRLLSYRPEETRWYKEIDPFDIEAHADVVGPETLLVLLELYTPFTIDDVEELCRSQNLQSSSSWEYMWHAIDGSLERMFNTAFWGFRSGDRTEILPLSLTPEWRWRVSIDVGRLYIGSVPTTLWPVLSHITTSVILLSLNFDPVRVLQFVESCKRCEEWINRGGKPPDLKFPYERNPSRAYYLLAAPQIVKELGE